MGIFQKILRDESGALSFEWILITTLLVIGVVGGLAAVRDAFVVSFYSGARAAAGLNQNFTSPPNTYDSFSGNTSYTFELKEGTVPTASTYP